MSKRPIFELSGHSAGLSLPQFACTSVHAVCPSAASGLIESPSGRSTSTDRIEDGVGDGPSVWAARRDMSIPEGESASLEVRPALSTGWKTCWSHPVGGGYWSSACETWVGSW